VARLVAVQADGASTVARRSGKRNFSKQHRVLPPQSARVVKDESYTAPDAKRTPAWWSTRESVPPEQKPASFSSLAQNPSTQSAQPNNRVENIFFIRSFQRSAEPFLGGNPSVEMGCRFRLVLRPSRGGCGEQNQPNSAACAK